MKNSAAQQHNTSSNNTIACFLLSSLLYECFDRCPLSNLPHVAGDVIGVSRALCQQPVTSWAGSWPQQVPMCPLSMFTSSRARFWPGLIVRAGFVLHFGWARYNPRSPPLRGREEDREPGGFCSSELSLGWLCQGYPRFRRMSGRRK